MLITEKWISVCSAFEKELKENFGSEFNVTPFFSPDNVVIGFNMWREVGGVETMASFIFSKKD